MSMISDLSFVASSKNGFDMWSPDRTGDYVIDCAKGREHGRELIEHMSAHRGPNLLGSVIRSMVSKDQYGGVEIGFCAAIAEAAIGARIGAAVQADLAA